LEAAFRLLHDRYVAEGYMAPHPSGLRITKYHALPSTSTIVAKMDGVVVGTVSLVRSGSFGLPLSGLFDVSEYRNRGARLTEVSSLAIDRAYSHRRGAIFFPLFKYLYEYSTKYFGTDYYVIAVHPKWIDFYKAVLFFKELDGGSVRRYTTVNGAPAVGAIACVAELYQQAMIEYSRKPAPKNLFRFFAETEHPSFVLPKRDLRTVNDPVMTPESLNYFFNEKSNVLETLSDEEKHTLFYLYDSEEHRRILPAPNQERPLRVKKRFDVDCSARLLIPGKDPITMEVKSVSRDGIGGVTERRLRTLEVYTLQIAMSAFDIVEVRARIRWAEPRHGAYGFAIVEPGEEWLRFIDRLDDDLMSPEETCAADAPWLQAMER
jgi:hypothetical protein